MTPVKNPSAKRILGQTRPAHNRKHHEEYRDPEAENLTINPDELEADICKESFFEFVKVFWKFTTAEPLQLNWHMRYLCDQMQKVAGGVFRGFRKEYDLCVNISPGTSKSTLLSVLFPAWAWTRMPTAQVICASYSEGLALDLSLKCRDVIQSELYKRYYPHVKLRDDQNTKHNYKNTRGGYRYSVGVNGTVTGMHGHFIIIDDPLNPEAAQSELELHAANRWIRQTLSSRKVDKAVAVTVLVMQRLHQDDPTANFTSKKRVKHVVLPAIDSERVHPAPLRRYYRKDPLYPDLPKVMDPKRLGHDVLDEAMENGQYYFQGQFMQSPVPPGGGMFQVNRIKSGVPPEWRAKPEILRRSWQRLVRFWDKAGTEGAGAFSVGTLMGLDREGRFWVLDVQRFRTDSHERELRIAVTAEQDSTVVEVGIEQEPGSGGKGSAQDTVRRLGEMGSYRVRIQVANKALGNKVQRADPFSVQVNAGNVYVPRNVDWFDEWVEELKYFPHSRYKDQVDSVSGAYSICHRRVILAGPLSNEDPNELWRPDHKERLRFGVATALEKRKQWRKDEPRNPVTKRRIKVFEVV